MVHLLARPLWALAWAVLIGVWAGPASAQKSDVQSESSVRRTAVAVGLGTASTPDYDVLGLLRLARTRGIHRFSGRLAGGGNILEEDGWMDLSVLYGPGLSWRWGQVAVGGGVGLAWGEPGSWTRPGLAFGSTFYLTPPIGHGTIGAMVSAVGIVNERQSAVGLTFGILLGKLR